MANFEKPKEPVEIKTVAFTFFPIAIYLDRLSIFVLKILAWHFCLILISWHPKDWGICFCSFFCIDEVKRFYFRSDWSLLNIGKDRCEIFGHVFWNNLDGR